MGHNNRVRYLYFLLLFVFIKLVSAQDISLDAVNISGGMVLPQGDWNSGLLMQLHLDTGEAIEEFHIVPVVGYWRTSSAKEVSEISDKMVQQNLFFGSRVHRFILNRDQGLYAGSSVQFHIIWRDLLVPKFRSKIIETENKRTTKVGFSGLVGYLFRFQPMALFIESSYNFVPDGFSTLQFTSGIRYSL